MVTANTHSTKYLRNMYAHIINIYLLELKAKNINLKMQHMYNSR